MADAVTLEVESGAATITLNRPDSLNSWNEELGRDLAAALERAGRSPEVRAVMITGAGRAFSSGADLAEQRAGAEGEVPDLSLRLRELYNPIILSVRELPKPVLAAVNGPAAGIGCSLALACDLVVAADSAYFLLAFTNVGLMPDGGATVLVPASLGRSRALQLALVPERLPAARAHEWGLVHRVVPDDGMAEAVAELTRRLVAGAPRAYAATKRAINDVTLAGLERALTAEVAGQTELLGSADFRQAVAAFADKRPPSFTGE